MVRRSPSGTPKLLPLPPVSVPRLPFQNTDARPLCGVRVQDPLSRQGPLTQHRHRPLRASLLCSGRPAPQPWGPPPHAPTRAPGSPAQPASAWDSPPPSRRVWGPLPGGLAVLGCSPCPGHPLRSPPVSQRRGGPPGAWWGDSLLLPCRAQGWAPVGLGAQAEQTREPHDHGLSPRRVQQGPSSPVCRPLPVLKRAWSFL